ncbi:MAG TPA: glycosyltransferase family 39 protein [Rhodopila sp.]
MTDPGTAPIRSDEASSGRGSSGVIVDCAVLVGLAATLRFAWLGHASLWIDELFSVCWSQLDWHFLLREGARTETNPPTYYILLHAWMEVFGTTETAVRVPSALASTATVLVVYAIGRMMKDRRVAMLAALLLAVNPVAVASAPEARAYALSAFLDGVGLLSIVGYVRRFGTIGTWSWGWLGAFVFSMIATASVHYTSLLFVAACFGAMGWRLVTTRPFPVREALAWVAAGLLTALVLAKLLILAASLSESNNLVWIGPLTVWSVVSFFLELIVQLPETDAFLTVSWLVCAAFALVVIGARPRLRGDRQFGVLILIPVLYCALFIIAGWLRPMLLARVATWLVIPLCLILARAALSQSGRWRSYAACAVPLLTFLFSTGYYYRFHEKEDWRGAIRLIATQPNCAGPLLVSEFNALGLYYYKIPAHRQAYVFLPDPRRRNSVEFSLSERLMHLPELDPGAIIEFIETHPGTAVIMRWEYREVIPLDLQTLLAHAPTKARLDGGLTVACF